MRKLSYSVLGLTVALSLVPAVARPQADPTARARNQPAEPYRIAGNLYYVGASDITAYLIATPQGHILLDGGFEQTAPIIEASIAKLGFKLTDVKILLNSHAHFDHAGGLAALKAKTGAPLYAGAEDAEILARGGKGDFALGDEGRFPPVQVDHPVHDRDTVSLGGTTLTAYATPGHTRGNTTWSMQVEESGKRYNVVFTASTSINPGVHLAGKESYPGIAADYAKTFEVLKGLPCDIFLGTHAQFFDGLKKAEALKLRPAGGANPFVDPAGYRAYLAGSEKSFREHLAQERAAKPAGG